MVDAVCVQLMKHAGAAPADPAGRLRASPRLLARLCSMLNQLGLPEGTKATKPRVEAFIGWLQVSGWVVRNGWIYDLQGRLY
eukprot:SAG11_NODE_18135_length_499_cov_0.712500_1_plen_82_part_00